MSNTATQPARSLQRLVRRMRCGTCGHLEEEHVPDCLCDCAYYEENVWLPVCVECKDRLCETDEDEICQHCWGEHRRANNMMRERRIAAGWRVDGTGGLHPPNDKLSDSRPE